jgi:predicted MFS family arabinose efflux permease
MKARVPVLVAALGYFVDIYDLILFSIVRIPSLKDLGLSGAPLFEQGIRLLNMQMAGMLVGGVFWGILGDKRGRLSVLFGSILLYSLANIANGMVDSIGAYAAWRFIAGIGLAGELGAGITLVSEVLPVNKRGLGTTIVASVGICGAVLAAQVAEHTNWRTAYFIGGGLGLALLLLRVGVLESGIFNKVKQTGIARGDIFYLFKDRARLAKYLRCILIGIPVWFVIGVLITFSPEFARELGVTGAPINGGKAVMFAYMGLAAGDLTSGLLSQLLRSRKKVVALFVTLTFVLMCVYLRLPAVSEELFYALCLALGFGVGYWAIFVTIGAEQFGTNLRSTVATTVPNFVRGSVVPLTLAFAWIKVPLGILPGAFIVGTASISIALLALWGLEESFSKELDYVEEAI